MLNIHIWHVRPSGDFTFQTIFDVIKIKSLAVQPFLVITHLPLYNPLIPNLIEWA